MLTFPDKFKDSFNSSVNASYPIIRLTGSSETFHIAQRPGSLSFGRSEVLEDRDLKVSSVKESIDIFDKKFKINNVTISLTNSNLLKGGNRFTEMIQFSDFTGFAVEIFYANEACETLADCPLIFKGYIRDYEVNQERVSFTAEDFSHTYLVERPLPKHENPYINTETVESRKNTRFPMVYGRVENSRLLFARPEVTSLVTKIYPDYIYANSGINIVGFANQEAPLKIFRDGLYLEVPRIFQEVPDPFVVNGFDYYTYYQSETEQYEIENDTIVLEKKISDTTYSQGMPLNIAARDQLQINAKRTPSGVVAKSSGVALQYGQSNQLTYNGPAEGYHVVGAGGNVNHFSFPDQTEGETQIEAGFYQDILLNPFFEHDRRHRYVNPSYPDFFLFSGEYWIANEYLRYSQDYGGEWDDYLSTYIGSTMPGSMDMWKYPDLSQLQQFINMPPGYDQISWLVMWEGRNYERHIIGEDPGTHDPIYSDYLSTYPKYGPYGSALGLPLNLGTNQGLPHAMIQNRHPMWEFQESGLRNSESGYYSRYPRFAKIAGIKLISSAGGPEIRLLWDGPIDVEQAIADMETHYSETAGLTYPHSRFPHSIYGGSFQRNIDDPWENGDLNQWGEPHTYIHPGSMDWVPPGEPKTLRKLIFGERVRGNSPDLGGDYGHIGFDELHSTPLGTWVYGCVPVLGYLKPKDATLTHSDKYTRSNGSGGWFRHWKVRADAMYAFGNPFFYGTEDGRYGNNVNENIAHYQESGEFFPNINELNRIQIQQDSVFRCGYHKQFGSDFGALYDDLYLESGNSIYTKPQLIYTGNLAVVGGSWCPLNYNEALGSEYGPSAEAAKLDITFNSLNGSDVIQAGVHSKLSGKIQVAFWKEAAATYTNEAENRNLNLLVECDAFQLGSSGQKNNVLQLLNIQTTDFEVGVATTDDDGAITEVNPSYNIKTGDSSLNDDLPEGADFLYSMGDIDFDIDIPEFFNQTCDVDFDIEDVEGEDDQWRSGVNAVNSVNLLYSIGPDITTNDLDDSGEVTEEARRVENSVSGWIQTSITDVTLNQRYIVGNISDLEYFANVIGRRDINSGAVLGDVEGFENPVQGEYTGNIINYIGPGSEDSEAWLIKSPPDIFRHILVKELDIPLDSSNMDNESIASARANHQDWDFNFSISEEIGSREFIEEFSKSTLFIPKITAEGKFKFINILQNVSSSDLVINSKDVIKFKFSKTPKEDLHLKVRVIYGYKEGLNDYTAATNGGNGGAVPVNKEELMEAYQINHIQDTYLEIKSRFINVEGLNGQSTARRLRNFYLEWHKNRHNIIECTLPHNYIHLECGDVVEFDSLIQGVTMFGKDYTQSFDIYGQEAFPYFLIESVSKSVYGVDIKAVQLHRLNMADGSLDIIEEDPVEDFLYDIDDVAYEPIGTCYLDINDDGDYDDEGEVAEGLTQNQCEINGGQWEEYPDEFITLGDVNFDGDVNILDVVIVQRFILGLDELNVQQQAAADVNIDDVISVQDIIIMVNQLLGNE